MEVRYSANECFVTGSEYLFSNLQPPVLKTKLFLNGRGPLARGPMISLEESLPAVCLLNDFVRETVCNVNMRRGRDMIILF